MPITMHLEGFAELERALDQLSRRVSVRVQRNALMVAAEPTRRAMAVHAPHEPGKPDLRDSMTVSPTPGEDANEIAVAIGPSQAGWYGSFQEFGTSRHAAQPFVRPAFDETVEEAAQAIADELRNELDFL
jgi:HK97 gp10 family phage protein